MNYTKMTAVELNEAEAAALVIIREIKAERARRTAPKSTPTAPVLPLPESAVAGRCALIEACGSSLSARTEMNRAIRQYKITVAGLRALASHWNIGTTTKMRKSEIVDLIVDVLVGHRLDSA